MTIDDKHMTRLWNKLMTFLGFRRSRRDHRARGGSHEHDSGIPTGKKDEPFRGEEDER